MVMMKVGVVGNCIVVVVVGYCIVVVVVGDCNKVIVVVAFCELLFVIFVRVLKLSYCYLLGVVVLVECSGDGGDGRVLQ